MTALPPVTGVAAFIVQGRTAAGTPWQNTYHVKIGALTIDGALMTAMQTILENAYAAGSPSFKAELDSSWSTVQTIIRDLRPSPEATLTAPETSIVGTAAGDGMPPDTALVLKWGTGLAGKSFRGRTYHAGHTETHNTVTGRPDSSLTTAAVTFGNSMITNFASGPGPLVVVSYFNNKAVRATPVVTNITNVSVDPYWQRIRARQT